MSYLVSLFLIEKRDDTTAKHSPFFLDFVDPPLVQISSFDPRNHLINQTPKGLRIFQHIPGT